MAFIYTSDNGSKLADLQKRAFAISLLVAASLLCSRCVFVNLEISLHSYPQAIHRLEGPPLCPKNMTDRSCISALFPRCLDSAKQNRQRATFSQSVVFYIFILERDIMQFQPLGGLPKGGYNYSVLLTPRGSQSNLGRLNACEHHSNGFTEPTHPGRLFWAF